MNIGKIIKDVRKAKNIKQYELAEKSGLSTAALCLIEQGKSYPSNNNLKKIFESLEIKESYLLVLLEDKELLIKL